MKVNCVCRPVPRLIHRVTIQRVKASPTRDTSGNNAELNDDANWENVATKPASVTALGGSERFASDQWQAGHTHRVEMRADNTTAAITPEDRLRFTTRGTVKTLYVVSAAENFETHMVVCICSETRT